MRPCSDHKGLESFQRNAIQQQCEARKELIIRFGKLALFSFATILILSFSASGQNPTAPTLKVYSRETIVDVTVTDGKGSPVHGLTRDDFTIEEDSKPQSIHSFEEFDSKSLRALPRLPPNIYTNSGSAAASGAINLLLLDFTNAAPGIALACCEWSSSVGATSLNLAMDRQRRIKQYAMQYLQTMPAGTRVAVLATSHPGNLRVLQGVTSDPALLSAAVASMKNDTDGNIWIYGPPLRDPVGMTLESWCSQQAVRNRMTLEALDQIAVEAAGIKGRKNLLWFTTGIPSLTDPNYNPVPLRQGRCLPDYSGDLKKAYGVLAAAQVTAFPIWVRGVPVVGDPVIESWPNEQLSMEAVAEATGGAAFYNSNDLASLTANAANAGSEYYTLSYVPPGNEYDGRHHTIKIVAARPGLKLTYRHEYYAEDPASFSNAMANKASPMQTALTRGLLPPTQILFRVSVAPSPTTSATLASDNQPDPKKMKPPYRHYSISYLIDVHGISFAPGEDGNYRGKFEYGVRVYGADSDDILNSTARTVSPILPPSVYQSMLTGGANAHQEIDVPATGDYVLRIAVRDIVTGHVGSIEIPTASLTPTPAGAP